MRRFLVLRGGALGDFIVTLPALDLLRQRWPAARIELIGNATAAAVARPRGLLDAVHSQHEGRWRALYGTAPLPRPLADWLASFDLVVNYWPDPDGELRRRFPQHPGQTFLFADALPATAPAAAHYCRPLSQIGITPRNFRFSLATPCPTTNPASEPLLIHPGSGSPDKNWPTENWIALLRLLPPPVELVLGEAEADRWPDSRLPGIPRLAHRPLEELISRFSRCRCFLGHDSGISHLAAACGAPCLLLFGPTDPALWAPPGLHVQTIRRGPSLAAITVDEVARALRGRDGSIDGLRCGGGDL